MALKKIISNVYDILAAIAASDSEFEDLSDGQEEKLLYHQLILRAKRIFQMVSHATLTSKVNTAD